MGIHAVFQFPDYITSVDHARAFLNRLLDTRSLDASRFEIYNAKSLQKKDIKSHIDVPIEGYFHPDVQDQLEFEKYIRERTAHAIAMEYLPYISFTSCEEFNSFGHRVMRITGKITILIENEKEVKR